MAHIHRGQHPTAVGTTLDEGKTIAIRERDERPADVARHGVGATRPRVSQCQRVWSPKKEECDRRRVDPRMVANRLDRFEQELGIGAIEGEAPETLRRVTLDTDDGESVAISVNRR